MPKEEITIREVQKGDMKEVIGLLQSISVFFPPKNKYSEIWAEFHHQKNVYSVVAIVNKRVVAYGSLVIEIKIRGGKAGHIEDIVSHPNFQNKGLGRSIVNKLYDISLNEGCYKVSLQCKEHNEEFYKKCSYKKSGISMQRFK